MQGLWLPAIVCQTPTPFDAHSPPTSLNGGFCYAVVYRVSFLVRLLNQVRKQKENTTLEYVIMQNTIQLFDFDFVIQLQFSGPPSAVLVQGPI